MGKVMTERHHSIPRSQLEFVGAVIFHWATIEHELVDMIGTSLKVGLKERRIMLTRMDAKAKLGLLKVVGSKFTKNVKIRKQINALHTACDRLYELRNKIAHGAWVHPVNNSDVYELLIIDSGESAYLPTRMAMSLVGRRAVVEQFAFATKATRTILNNIATEMGLDKGQNRASSVSSAAERSTALVVPDKPPDLPD